MTDIPPLDRLDAIVVDLWYAAQHEGASATQLMRARFRDSGLEARQQKRVKERFHRVLANRARIDFTLERVTPSGSAGVDALEGALRVMMSRVLDRDMGAAEAARYFPWVAWDRVAGMDDEIAACEDPVERVELLASVPKWLAARIVQIFGDEAEACARSLAERPPVTIRCNTLRCSRDDLQRRLAGEGIDTRPTMRASDGLEVVGPAQLFRARAFHHGWFEMQDEASQLVAELVAPPPGGLVVDACAGAGGKTLAIAGLMQGRGSIVALDTSWSRLKELRKRARRAGVRNLRVMTVDAASWNDEVQALMRKADRILIDAPCSGIGSLRRKPEMRQRLSEDELGRLGKIQRDLCTRASALLAPHARLIYATCTILPEENEAVVQSVEAAIPELERVRAVEILGTERIAALCDPSGTYLQCTPHRHGCDGFFTAILRRPKSSQGGQTTS